MIFYSHSSNFLSLSCSFSLYSLIVGRHWEQIEYSVRVESSLTLKDFSFLVSWQLWQVKGLFSFGVDFICSLVFFLNIVQQGWQSLPSGSSRTSKESSWEF